MYLDNDTFLVEATGEFAARRACNPSPSSIVAEPLPESILGKYKN
jgi:hypothetical protein